MRYYWIIIQVEFDSPRAMLPLPHSKKPWRAGGYIQTFYCTEESKDKAKQFVRQHFLKHEENPSTCQMNFDHVERLQNLNRIEQITHGYETGLTEEMFANRNKTGIWYASKKEYYISDEDYSATIADEDEFWSGYEGQCQACDIYGPVNDMSLCDECAGKLERDLIRQRDWDYSASAFGLSNELREKLRIDVIKKYGKDLELIAPSKNKKKKRRKS